MSTVYAAIMVVIKECLLICRSDVGLRLFHNDANTKLNLLP